MLVHIRVACLDTHPHTRGNQILCIFSCIVQLPSSKAVSCIVTPVAESACVQHLVRNNSRFQALQRKWNICNKLAAIFSLVSQVCLKSVIKTVNSLKTQASLHSLAPLTTIGRNQQWNISHSSAMMRANHSFLAALCPCVAFGAKSASSSIFGGNSEPIRLLEHKRGTDYRQFLFCATEEGRVIWNLVWAGCWGYVGKFGFGFLASRTLQWNTCVDQRQRDTCVLTTSKHVPPCIGKPLWCVCVTLLWSLQVAAWPKEMAFSSFWEFHLRGAGQVLQYIQTL